MRKLFESIAAALAAGESVVTATIVRKSGSAPRSDGAKMLVRADGTIAGSVGGGRLEAETLALARGVFRTRGSELQVFDLTGADASGTDMICGGRGEILLDWVDAADGTNVAVFAAAAAALARGESTWLLTAPGTPGAPTRRALLARDRRVVGADVASPAARADVLAAPGHAARLADLAGERVMVEPLRPGGRLVVFGAGHCAQSLAPLAVTVGFDVTVVDDRAEFADRARYPEPTALVVIESFEHLPDLDIDSDCALVIMTRGHLHDLTTLEHCLRTRAGYVGMIGSVRKRDKVYEVLRRRGFADADFARVHAPIGIEIAAETPEEIAISIVAELVAARAARWRAGA